MLSVYNVKWPLMEIRLQCCKNEGISWRSVNNHFSRFSASVGKPIISGRCISHGMTRGKHLGGTSVKCRQDDSNLKGCILWIVNIISNYSCLFERSKNHEIFIQVMRNKNIWWVNDFIGYCLKYRYWIHPWIIGFYSIQELLSAIIERC